MVAKNIQLLTNSHIDSAVLLEGMVSQNQYPVSNLQRNQLSLKWRTENIDYPQQITADLGDDLVTCSGFSLQDHNFIDGTTVRLTLFDTDQVDVDTTDITHGTTGLGSVQFTAPHGITDLSANPAIYISEGITPTYGAWLNGGIFDVTNINSATSLQIAVPAFAGGGSYPGWPVKLLTRKHDASHTVNSAASYVNGSVPIGMSIAAALSNNSSSNVSFWFPDVLANYCRVMIDDTTNADGYLEAGRIMLGDALSPKYNMVWGQGMNNTSSTTLVRLRNGAMTSSNMPSWRVLNFTLMYMSEEEAVELLDMFEYPANKTDMVVSLFPDDTGKLGERTTILGRITNHGDITLNRHGYSCPITFEESL